MACGPGERPAPRALVDGLTLPSPATVPAAQPALRPRRRLVVALALGALRGRIRPAAPPTRCTLGPRAPDLDGASRAETRASAAARSSTCRSAGDGRGRAGASSASAGSPATSWRPPSAPPATGSSRSAIPIRTAATRRERAGARGHADLDGLARRARGRGRLRRDAEPPAPRRGRGAGRAPARRCSARSRWRRRSPTPRPWSRGGRSAGDALRHGLRPAPPPGASRAPRRGRGRTDRHRDGGAHRLRLLARARLVGRPASANWRIDAAQAGGGALMDLAPHGLDLVDFLLGEPIVDHRGPDCRAACRTTPSTTARC